MSDDRLKELRKFWYIAGQIGTEYAYDVIERLYGHRSLRKLTIDEMETVVFELLDKTGIRLRSKKKRTYLTKRFFQEAGYEVNFSDAQRKKISVLYDQSMVSKGHFLQILEHVAPEGYLGPKQAGKIIGALNSYMKREESGAKVSPEPAGPKVSVKPEGFMYFEFKVGHG
jgi:thioredoxin-related protein